MSARYLVTGANGFVGRRLCERLQAQGDAVRALLRRPLDGPWHEHAIWDLGSAAPPAGLTDGIDGIYHLAGIAHRPDLSGAGEDIYERVNVHGTRALLAAALAGGVRRLVFFSSIKAAGDPGERCVDEDWTAPPEDAYGRSKLAAEQLLLQAQAEHGLHLAILRPTLVYGAHPKGNLERMIRAIAAGRWPPLPDFGNRRSMIALDDLVDAAFLTLHDPRAAGRTYIVADGRDYATRELAELIAAAVGRRLPGWSIPPAALKAAARLGDLLVPLLRKPPPLTTSQLQRLSGSACYRADRLRQELGWEPRLGFADLVDAMARSLQKP